MDGLEAAVLNPGIKGRRDSPRVGTPSEPVASLVLHNGECRRVSVPHDGHTVPRDILQIRPNDYLQTHILSGKEGGEKEPVALKLSSLAFLEHFSPTQTAPAVWAAMGEIQPGEDSSQFRAITVCMAGASGQIRFQGQVMPAVSEP